MPCFREPTKYIHFHNDSVFPINIESWVDGSNCMKSIRIGPFEKKIIHSSVGEWHMDFMLDSEEDKAPWLEHNLYRLWPQLGKFRSDPCASGNYSWMEYNTFECRYEDFSIESDSRVKGQITFRYVDTQEKN